MVTLDGVDGHFDCYVRAVDGAIASLDQLGGVVPELRDRLSPGSTGYVISNDAGGRLALRGVATAAPDGGNGFAFVVLDGLAHEERRGAPRLPLVATARTPGIDDAAAEGAIATVTADISQSGALLERRTGLDVGVRLALELVFDGFPAGVWCEAEVVRDTLTHVGVKFTAIEERDRARLAVILAHNRRQLGPIT